MPASDMGGMGNPPFFNRQSASPLFYLCWEGQERQAKLCWPSPSVGCLGTSLYPLQSELCSNAFMLFDSAQYHASVALGAMPCDLARCKPQLPSYKVH